MNNTEIAYKYQKRLRWKKAELCWVTILSETPEDQYALSNLLKCQSVMGNLTNAQDTAERLEKIGNLTDDSIISLADYYLDTAEPETATIHYRSIESNSPFYLLSILGLSLSYIRLNRFAEAKVSIKVANDLPIRMWEEYAEWAQVYLTLRDYPRSVIAWIQAFRHADSINAGVYAVSSLLSLPLLATSNFAENVYSGAVVVIGVILLFLNPPWSVALFLVLLPVLFGGIVRHLMLGRPRVIFGLVLIMSSFLFLAYLDIE